MNLDLLFQLANLIVLPGWILLIVLPRWKWTISLVRGLVIILLSVLYVYLIAGALKPDEFTNFSSLEGLMTLFKSPRAVFAGWVHYLAFDMLAGSLILQDSQKRGISHWLVIPCMLFSFMLGPAGWLLYYIIRWVKTGKYFIAEK